MKSIPVLHFLELKVLAVFEPHPPKFLQGKKREDIGQGTLETRTAGFHHGLEHGCIKRLVSPKQKPSLFHSVWKQIHLTRAAEINISPNCNEPSHSEVQLQLRSKRAEKEYLNSTVIHELNSRQ